MKSEYTTNFDEFIDKHSMEIREVGQRFAEPFKSVNRNYSLMAFVSLSLSSWVLIFI